MNLSGGNCRNPVFEYLGTTWGCSCVNSPVAQPLGTPAIFIEHLMILILEYFCEIIRMSTSNWEHIGFCECNQQINQILDPMSWILNLRMVPLAPCQISLRWRACYVLEYNTAGQVYSCSVTLSHINCSTVYILIKSDQDTEFQIRVRFRIQA